MVRSSRTTAGNHGHLHRLGNHVGNRKFVTVFHAIRIDGVKANLAHTQIFGLLGPFESIDAHRLAASTDKHLVAARNLVRNAHKLRVHTEHHTLATKGPCAVGNDFGVQHGKAIHAHLLGTGQKCLVHVIEVTDSATHCKRDKYALCNLANHFHVARAVFGACRNIVEHQFVDTVGTVLRTHLHGIANVDISLELDALRDLAVTDIKTNNQAFGQH